MKTAISKESHEYHFLPGTPQPPAYEFVDDYGDLWVGVPVWDEYYGSEYVFTSIVS